MIKFGTGGWRAIIGDEFTRENVQRLAFAICKRMEAEDCAGAGFCIGYDRRFLSREAAQWASEVFAARNIHVFFINREAPTPLVMFTIQHWNLPYGMVITASHNPALYNGVKVFTKGGRDAQQDVTDNLMDICATIKREDIPIMDYELGCRKGIIEEMNPFNAYIDAIIRAINMDAIRSRELKVVLDPMYGVSRTALQTVLVTARCDVTLIHDRHDTLFGGRLPAPNEKTLDALRSSVVESGADIGIATDGDADRLGIIDDAGRFIHPNEILVLLYYYLVKYKRWHGPAVRNIATTHLLDSVAHAFGEECYEVPVGFKHVSAAMTKYNAVIGGESSGGLTVRGHISGKDGIYAAALLVEMLAVTGKSLSEMYKEITDNFGEHYMVEHDIKFDKSRKAALLKTLMEDQLLPEFDETPEKVSYLDGCKVYWKKGWIIVRFSGTEPLLRIFCEMPTVAKAEKECLRMREFLNV